MGFLSLSRHAASHNESAVGHLVMVCLKLLFRDEVYRGIVLVKVVGHGLDLMLDLCLVCAFLGHNPALSQVFLAGGQLRLVPLAHLIHGFFHRNRILNTSLHSGNPADRVGMSLAYALAPESIGFSVGENGLRVQPVQREQTRIPAHGDQTHMAVFAAGSVHRIKMLGNIRMGIKAVDDMEIFCHLRRLFGKIRGTSAAEDHHIDLICHILRLIHPVYLHAFGGGFYACGIPAGENSCQLHVLVLTDGQLHASSQITISCNSDSDFFHLTITSCRVATAQLSQKSLKNSFILPYFPPVFNRSGRSPRFP